MNLRKNQKGFTIVELLIVVVVIAILAAISIVAYTGITNRANRSAAMEAANSVKSVAVAFEGANSAYPTTKAQFVAGHNGTATNAIAKLPSDITFKCLAPVAADDPKVVQVMPWNQGGSIVGMVVTYWDYAPTDGQPIGVRTMNVGTTAAPATVGTAISNTATAC